MMNRRTYLVTSILISGLIASACGTSSGLLATKSPPYRIVAYLYGGRAEIHRISAMKLTHINYAFALVNEAGELYFRETDEAENLAQLQGLKAANPRLKIILSVGGWGADHFSDAALTESSRQKFAGSAIEMIRRYGLDGIDIDWEYPGQPGPGIKYRQEDKQNFTLLLKTLREQLDALSQERGRDASNRFILTIASSAGKYFEHTEMDRLHVYLDWINVMTYDFAGEWTPTTGHHAGLYPKGGHTGPSGSAFIIQHLAAGIPPDKLVLGVPFYGRGWSRVNPANNGLNQPYQGEVSEYSWVDLDRGYVNQRGFMRHWDPLARAPYLWNAESATFISYEDPESLQEKARFITQQGLGGVMFWEYRHDPEEVLLDVLWSDLR